MPHKNVKEHRDYSRNYYQTHPICQEKNKANKRLQYWRKEYLKKFKVPIEYIVGMTEEELRKRIKEGNENA